MKWNSTVDCSRKGKKKENFFPDITVVDISFFWVFHCLLALSSFQQWIYLLNPMQWWKFSQAIASLKFHIRQFASLFEWSLNSILTIHYRFITASFWIRVSVTFFSLKAGLSFKLSTNCQNIYTAYEWLFYLTWTVWRCIYFQLF